MQSILDQGMPKTGGTVYLQYPWGVTLTIRRTHNDSSDLAAQSTEFRYEFTGPKGTVLKAGHFTAIGGLCGSYEDCYYPGVRQLERRLTKQVNLRAIVDGQYFPDTWDVLVATFVSTRIVVAIKSARYGVDWIWLKTPVDIGGLNVNLKDYGNYLTIDKALFDAVLAELPMEETAHA